MANKVSYASNTFLTERQAEILRMRKNNISRMEIARLLKITRQDVTILEKRALRNVERAFNTIKFANQEGYSVRLKVAEKTQILDAIREILDTGNRNGVKIALSIPELFTMIRMSQHGKIKNGILSSGMEINILPDGKVILDQ
ncbi:MAG: Tfx family DNA-binding protein [Thermoplasmataceae archaeon]